MFWKIVILGADIWSVAFPCCYEGVVAVCYLMGNSSGLLIGADSGTSM